MIRWGILGCGNIARKFASDIQLVNNAELVAVAARSAASADTFAKDYPAKFVHYSYEELVNNEEVDVIYVATPHGLHHEHVLLCLEHNKAVMCEKAFALNKKQAEEMIAKAKEKNVFLMEALWTKFLPSYNKLQQLLKEQLIGDVKSVVANFGFRPKEPLAPRIYDPALGGGTVLDIGIYNIFMAMSVLGKPDAVEAVMTPASTGIDAQCAVTFTYKNGAIAQLFSSFLSDLPTEMDIAGTKGRLHLGHRFYTPFAPIDFYSGRPDTQETITIEQELNGWGYQYQIDHVSDCLEKGLKESPVMTFTDTLELMEVMDEVRAKAGIRYDADEK